MARAAVAHEAVVESFIGASAVVPMKLFTIFTSDERALEHMRRDAPRVDAVLRRAGLVPEVFYVDDEDELHILTSEVPPELADRVREAVMSCPKTALLLEE